MKETPTAPRKRLPIVMGITGGALLVVAIVVIVLTRPHNPVQTTLAEIQKTNKTTCLLKQDDPNVKLSESDGTHIGNAAMTGIIDVPAGTKVDVHVKTYSDSSVTGTAVYPDKYGSYNFTFKKTGNAASDTYTGGWALASIQACE